MGLHDSNRHPSHQERLLTAASSPRSVSSGEKKEQPTVDHKNHERDDCITV